MNASVSAQGLVIVYTGILAAAETDDEIAAVMSHEIAHVLAHHEVAGASGQLLATLAVLPALPFFAAGFLIPGLAVIAAPPVILGSVILLALSREREAEADKMGMLLMTEAGFDPSAAVSFWGKIGELEREVREKKGARQVAEFQSTHPHVSFLAEDIFAPSDMLGCVVGEEGRTSRVGCAEYPVYYWQGTASPGSERRGTEAVDEGEEAVGGVLAATTSAGRTWLKLLINRRRLRRVSMSSAVVGRVGRTSRKYAAHFIVKC